MLDKESSIDGGVTPVNLNAVVGFLVSVGELPKTATHFPGKKPQVMQVVMQHFARCDELEGGTRPWYIKRSVLIH